MQNPPCKQQRDVKRGGKLLWAFLCGRDSAAGPTPGGVQGPEALRQPLKRREHISDTWWASSLKTRGLNSRIYILFCINTELYTVINKQQLPGVTEMAPLSPRRRCFILLCLAAIQISQAAVQVRVLLLCPFSSSCNLVTEELPVPCNYPPLGFKVFLILMFWLLTKVILTRCVVGLTP